MTNTVAIDFDNCISRSPQMFQEIMNTFELNGYHVIVVTYRQPTCFPEDLDFLVEKGYHVYFTSQMSKKDYMEEKGIDVAIWIDDDPMCLTHSYNPLSGKYYKEYGEEQ